MNASVLSGEPSYCLCMKAQPDVIDGKRRFDGSDRVADVRRRAAVRADRHLRAYVTRKVSGSSSE